MADFLKAGRAIVMSNLLTTGMAMVVGLSAAVAVFLQTPGSTRNDPHLFSTGDSCFSCHNQLVAPSGEDVSIGTDWRASMMANSARDPYWQATVRREVMDHPESAAEIEDKCAACHMPMSRFEAKATGELGKVFAHLPAGGSGSRADELAMDGVSCTICHQITGDSFGDVSSFSAGFAVDTELPLGSRAVYGPYEVESGLRTLMHSASGFRQEESLHIQKSELCATCHTLVTDALGPGGEVIGQLPEQVPYLEWRHSSFAYEHSCQSCHMPVIDGETAISSVLGKQRTEVSRHVFRGGNFFMLRMLNRYRDELGVAAYPKELEISALRTEAHLKVSSARVKVVRAERSGDRLVIDVSIENLAGHKLPTGYPSRRTWINLTVEDSEGRTVFESGRLQADGRIVGNDNDDDGGRFEPHYDEISSPDQVQIYESVMADTQGQVTTGLLSATGFIKDNRLLPLGFDKAAAGDSIAVRGAALADPDFAGGSDSVRYVVDLARFNGTLVVRAGLWYQPIGFRWAHNLEDYDAPETHRFVGYYESMADDSGLELAHDEQIVPDG